MTDKELFKKAEKIFKLNENIVEKCYKNGQFNKILNENIGSSARTSKQVGNPDFKKSGGGLLGGLARGIGGAVKAPFKLAAAGGRGYRQAQSEKAQMQREREKTKQERLKTKKLKQELKRKPQKPATSDYVNTTTLAKPIPTAKPTVTNVKFKVGDEVFVKTKKNPKAVGTVSAIIDKPGFIQIKVNGGVTYAFDKRNVSLKRGVNKESYKRQS
jgi:hypothetical protein